VRPVRHAHLLENELLQEIVGFLPPHAVGMANHGSDRVNERLGDGASDFVWKPTKVVALLCAEGNRVIAVVVDPVAGPGLSIVTVARRIISLYFLLALRCLYLRESPVLDRRRLCP
jgi:hypothetical protein